MAVFVRAELSPSARPFGSRLAFPSGLAAVRWELRGRARSLDAEHQVDGFGELDGGEGVPVPGADPVPGGMRCWVGAVSGSLEVGASALSVGGEIPTPQAPD